MIEQAKWITCGDACDAPILIRRFTVQKASAAQIEITGLGWFELRLNGKRVSEDHLTPVLSDYAPRDMSHWTYPIFDTTAHRIYYLVYDLLPLLREGENTLEIYLGNGWYCQEARITEGRMSFGKALPARYAISFTDQSGTQQLFSDGSESWIPSEIIYNNLFVGEVHDARRLSDARPEQAVSLFAGLDQIPLTRQTCPPDRIMRELVPKKIGTNGAWTLYDVGENISGWVRVKTHGASGERLTLRFAENVQNGRLDAHSTGSDYIGADGCTQTQTDTFICDGQPRVFEPRFSFHGFRYFEISGPYDVLTAAVVHADVPQTSAFDSDNEGLNFLFDAYIRTQQDNMHAGVPSDCPHRERLGYTGDGQITAETAMLLLDSREFYRKWMQDIFDCQDVSNGHVQHTAPMMGGGGGPGGYGCAIVLVPYRFYRTTGETAFLPEAFPKMCKWIDYLKSRMQNGLVVSEEKGGWCLGDWASLTPMNLPEPFVNTCYLVQSLRMMRELSAVIGTQAQFEPYAALQAEAEQAILRTYFDAETGSFCKGEQAADAYAAALGLGDERTVRNLAAHYRQLGILDTGFLGTDILLDTLFEKGYGDVAVQLLSGEECGTYLYMKRHGATTIWETMRGGDSHNHPMFGAPARLLFTRLLGIRQAEGSAGYAELVIAPCFPKGVGRACGSLKLPCGTVSVAWEKSGNTVTLQVTLPENKTGTLRIQNQSALIHSGKNEWKINL